MYRNYLDHTVRVSLVLADKTGATTHVLRCYASEGVARLIYSSEDEPVERQYEGVPLRRRRALRVEGVRLIVSDPVARFGREARRTDLVTPDMATLHLLPGTDEPAVNGFLAFVLGLGLGLG